ncbi:YeeE/YedE family protein [Bdellovibrio sp. HCB-162]|uniref:YeeE/YedE family protein n=1 Tax=Bdellovibrio sp. HCB-162 TaxID=3394234 RepID=UPI0039BD7875
MESIVMALIGGMMIGLASSLMLIFNGRVTGISGIANGFLSFVSGERLWRGAFLLGLIGGGALVAVNQPQLFQVTDRSLTVTILAGLFVGFGTVMGSGCTSGHGVCGISRLSIRSLVATAVFMSVGILIATLFRNFIGV